MSTRRAAGPAADLSGLIVDNLELRPIEGLPELRIYTATPRSRLSRLTAAVSDASPYWAYPWPGGVALARYILDHPETVRGCSVLDYGAGSGLLGIAAAVAGAANVTAVEIDPFGRAAAVLNAEANGITLADVGDAVGDALAVDLVIAGDVFYDAGVARRSIEVFDAFGAAGTPVLIGDPGRRDLPLDRLELITTVPLRDFGDGLAVPPAERGVYRWRP